MELSSGWLVVLQISMTKKVSEFPIVSQPKEKRENRLKINALAWVAITLTISDKRDIVYHNRDIAYFAACACRSKLCL